MKGRLAAFAGIFCIAILIASGAFAGKPDKPPKPGNITKECIVFTGDLESVAGGTVVEGCCPNAGPWPAYTMTFVDIAGWPWGPHEGQVFMNFFGNGPDREYKVQFWTWDFDAETPGEGDYFFQIYGGDVNYNKKTNVLTVTFTDELGTGWIYHDETDPTEISIPYVSFVLERTSDLSFCE